MHIDDQDLDLIFGSSELLVAKMRSLPTLMPLLRLVSSESTAYLAVPLPVVQLRMLTLGSRP